MVVTGRRKSVKKKRNLETDRIDTEVMQIGDIQREDNQTDKETEHPEKPFRQTDMKEIRVVWHSTTDKHKTDR